MPAVLSETKSEAARPSIPGARKGVGQCGFRSDWLRLAGRLPAQKSGGPPRLFGPFVLYDTMYDAMEE
jgi:hypothetical protein